MLTMGDGPGSSGIRAGCVTVRLTVVDPSRTGATADIEVSAAPGTPLGVVLGSLTATPGVTGTGQLFVDGRCVDDVPLGLPPLLEGALVTVGRAGGVHGRDAGTRAGFAEVHVTAGPGAGARHPLRPGVTTLGRGLGSRARPRRSRRLTLACRAGGGGIGRPGPGSRVGERHEAGGRHGGHGGRLGLGTG